MLFFLLSTYMKKAHGGIHGLYVFCLLLRRGGGERKYHDLFNLANLGYLYTTKAISKDSSCTRASNYGVIQHYIYPAIV